MAGSFLETISKRITNYREWRVKELYEVLNAEPELEKDFKMEFEGHDYKVQFRNAVVATLVHADGKNGLREVARGIAIQNPSDVYNAKTGSEIAFRRLVVNAGDLTRKSAHLRLKLWNLFKSRKAMA